MKMRNGILAGAACVFLVMSAGCDWDFGSNADSWSDRYNQINFSGVYRGPAGSRLITDYTSEAGTEGLDQYVSTSLVALSPDQTFYQGNLRHRVIGEGSVTVTGPAGLRWEDNGSGVLVAAGGNAQNGAINYVTGAWRLEIAAPVPSGTLRVTYAWVGDGSQVGISRPGAGSTFEIFTFTVQQDGNKLVIVDNTGATYSGKFGSVRSTTGESLDNPNAGPITGNVVASFEASGVSAANKQVTMVGTFQAGSNMSDRVLQGTWIEKNGKTGDIVGAAR